MIRVIAAMLPALILAGCSQAPVSAVDRSTTAQSRVAPAPQALGPGQYVVKRGDTLYRIALENGQDYRDLATWNNIANPSAIKEGQVLRVVPPGQEDAGGAVVAKPVVSVAVVETRSLDQPAADLAAPSNGMLKREPRAGKEPYSDEAYARLNRNGEVPAKVVPEIKPEIPVAPAPALPAAPAAPDDIGWQWPVPGKVLAPYSESGSKGLDIGGKPGDPVVSAGDGKVVYAGSGLRGYGELVIVKHNATYLSAYAHNRKILVKEGQQVSRGQKIAEMGNTDSETVKLHFEIRKQGKPVDPAQYLPKR